MSELQAAVPPAFPAFVVDRRDDGGFVRGMRELRPEDLPDGDILVRVEWSSVNYKDGLAAREDGRVARAHPLVPGIDLAGTVVRSSDPAFPAGCEILAHCYDLGVSRHGGYAGYASIPVDWAVRMPNGLCARDAMAIGTAGYTAATALVALEARGLRPGDGPVVVTGASGGVGSLAVAMLAARGHETWAMTGKPDQGARLRDLGAAGILGRAEAAAAGRPLESARWAGAIDTAGAPTLPWVLRTLRPGAAVAACGNAGGAVLETTVLPFILRGVALLGIDVVATPIDDRRALWSRLATDLRPAGLDDAVVVPLVDVEQALDAIVSGSARGRWIVRVAA